ncbi:MAG: RDD family protein [Acidobacteria bacterium]|nr:RDD family protein [Acidobacteriota bacterium]
MIEETTHTLENELLIETPEHVELRFVLASLGNRFLACAIDHTIQLVAVLMVFLMAEAIGYGIQRWSTTFAVQTVLAGAILANFLLIFGYFVFFEFWWNGQTPGKRWLGLRVISEDGRPVTFFQAMVRNLIRLIDMMPAAAILPSYFIGILSVFLNPRNRRLGDLAGGTVVVRERGWTPGGSSPPTSLAGSRRLPEPEAAETDATGRLPAAPSARTFQLLSTFLRRRGELDTGPRSHWASRIRRRVENEIGEPSWTTGLDDEQVLETLYREWLERPRWPRI